MGAHFRPRTRPLPCATIAPGHETQHCAHWVRVRRRWGGAECAWGGGLGRCRVIVSGPLARAPNTHHHRGRPRALNQGKCRRLHGAAQDLTAAPGWLRTHSRLHQRCGATGGGHRPGALHRPCAGAHATAARATAGAPRAPLAHRAWGARRWLLCRVAGHGLGHVGARGGHHRGPARVAPRSNAAKQAHARTKPTVEKCSIKRPRGNKQQLPRRRCGPRLGGLQHNTRTEPVWRLLHRRRRRTTTGSSRCRGTRRGTVGRCRVLAALGSRTHCHPLW